MALLLDVSHFQDTHLQQLRPLPIDVPALAVQLQDNGVGNFDTITVCADPTAAELCRQIASFFHWKRPHDLLLCFFAGPLLLDEDGELYMAGSDTQLATVAETAVPLTFLTAWMDRSFSRRKVVVCDTYHLQIGAHTTARTMPLGAKLEGVGTRRMLLAGSEAIHAIWHDATLTTILPPLRLTPILWRGLATGAANLNDDGQISVPELAAYARQFVAAAQLWTYDQKMPIIIANDVRDRSRKPPVKWNLVWGGVLTPLITVFIGFQSDVLSSLTLAGVWFLIYALLYLVLE